MKINYYKFWTPHINFRKYDVRDLSPKLYNTLSKMNYGLYGFANNTFKEIRHGRAKGYVIVLYAGEILIGYALHEYRDWCDEIAVNFWIKRPFRGMKLGQILIKESIRICPKKYQLCATEHDKRTGYLFPKIYEKYPKTFRYN